MGSLGKKEKKFAPGVEHCVSTANVKKRRSRHLYIGEYGKVPKMAVFGNFAPGNLKTEKNGIAYHVGIFFSKILAEFFFSKKVILAPL